MGQYKLTQDADRDVAQIYQDGSDMFGAIMPKNMRGADCSHVVPQLRRADYVSHAIYYRHTDYGDRPRP